MSGFTRYSGTETTIRIDSDVTSIPDGAFQDRDSLVNVVFPEGLQMIGSHAFDGCLSLKKIILPDNLLSIGSATFQECQHLASITIPKSVFVIGASAFSGCVSLKEVSLCEGGNLGVIGAEAFYNCSELRKINIPMKFTVPPPSDEPGIREQTFRACKTLTEVHFSEGIEHIDEGSFRDCTSLLRINVPSTVECIDEMAFQNCSLLRNVAISPESTLTFGNGWKMMASLFFQCINFCSLDMLRCRFDELPLHKACFYRDETILERLNDTVDDRLSAEYSTADCLGMTPLHILASSGTHDLGIYQCIVDKFPGALIATDKWGDVPLTYVMLSDAPLEILLFFLERHKLLWGTMPFDFATIIERLIECKKYERCIRQVIQAQRSVFPDLQVNWKDIVEESKKALCRVSIRVFQVLVEASASPQPFGMSLAHHLEINNRIDMLNNVYFDDPDLYLYGEGHSDRFSERIAALRNEGTPLDYDRLVGFDEDYRTRVLDEIQDLTIKFFHMGRN